MKTHVVISTGKALKIWAESRNIDPRTVRWIRSGIDLVGLRPIGTTIISTGPHFEGKLQLEWAARDYGYIVVYQPTYPDNDQ